MRDFVMGRCVQCSPREWEIQSGFFSSDHKCASDDEDGTYGTIVYSVPYDSPPGLRYVVHTWPQCVGCGRGYCTHCGAHEWYQSS